LSGENPGDEQDRQEDAMGMKVSFFQWFWI
jgi:hypothetical protein